LYSRYDIDDPWPCYLEITEGYYCRPRAEIDIKTTIKPLLQQVRQLDRIRLILEKEGGRRKEFEKLSLTLTTEIRLQNRYGSSRISLDQPAAIQKGLRELGCLDVHFEVRRLKNGLPAYFIGRLSHDYRETAPLILEELHQSPEFPVTDKRFIRLMHHGHELLHLNLAPYRQSIALNDKECDELLRRVGRRVLTAAWHEDQYPGLMVAELLGLHSFPIALELLYLILSSDLSYLRNHSDETIIAFFEKIHPQPAIAGFLKYLNQIEGSSLVQLPNLARKQYKLLASGLGELLQTRIRWGSRDSRIELYKIIFANFSRPETLADKLHNHSALTEAVCRVEKTANKLLHQFSPC